MSSSPANKSSCAVVRSAREYVGYFVDDAVWQQFYYSPVTQGKNVWLFMQLACMMLYALGVYLAFRDISRASRALS